MPVQTSSFLNILYVQLAGWMNVEPRIQRVTVLSTKPHHRGSSHTDWNETE